MLVSNHTIHCIYFLEVVAPDVKLPLLRHRMDKPSNSPLIFAVCQPAGGLRIRLEFEVLHSKMDMAHCKIKSLTSRIEAVKSRLPACCQ